MSDVRQIGGTGRPAKGSKGSSSPYEFVGHLTSEIRKKKIDYILRLREYVWNRAEGRPFVAENPEAKGKGNTIIHDQRLQLAIQQLIPDARKSKTPQLTAGTRVIDAQPGTDHDRQPSVEAQQSESGELPESTQKELARMQEIATRIQYRG